MSRTATTTQASTYTEARARAVMHHVLGDFMNVASAGLILRETIQIWFEELEYAVRYDVVDTFQLQLEPPKSLVRALNYTVRDDGSVQESSKAGGVDYCDLPPDTKVSLCVRYRQGAPNLERVREYLRGRGWTSDGSLVEGATNRDRAYSKDGYAIVRSRVGDWR